MDTQGRSVQGVGDIYAARSSRVLNKYKIPKKLLPLAGNLVGIGLVALTPDEEMMAAKRCGQVAIRLAWEQALESLRAIAVHGPPGPAGEPTVVWKSVSTADGTADKVWGEMNPKIRTLAVTAFGDVHQPEGTDVEDFLASREVSTG